MSEQLSLLISSQKDQFAGDAFRARASAEAGVKVSFRTYAYFWDGLPRHQTSYA
ncbi:hypothetical protein [Nisaea sp.]|uniref:hypothetical protein n=1 Tax=Nisaea sp. TaxID=2024842 RepID=UPI003266D67E